MSITPDWLEHELDAHRAESQRTWARLQEFGTDDHAELCVELAYDAPGSRQARRLMTALVERTDYAVELRTSRDGGGPLGRRRWHVVAHCPPAAYSLGTLLGWVDWLIRLGADEGECRFRGWDADAEHPGTRAPVLHARAA